MTQAHIDKFEWVGAIETASGKEFNLLEPSPEMYDMEDIARSLSLICRYNGHVPHFYSVAEHSVRVAWQLRFWECSPEVQITGLLHDASEAYLGDMVRPMKRLPDLSLIYNELEAKVASLLHEQFGGFYPYTDAIHQADREVYNWEVKNIRTGLKRGWEPGYAYDAFFDRYRYLQNDINGRLEHHVSDGDVHAQ